MNIPAQFHSKIAGVTFGGRQELIDNFRRVYLVREPDNQYDKNAIKILFSNGEQVGYINKDLAPDLSKVMDKGKNEVEAYIENFTGDDQELSTIGCNIIIKIK